MALISLPRTNQVWRLTSLTSSQPSCTARVNCHSLLALFNMTHCSSICAANVALIAALQQVPGPWSGMERPAGGGQFMPSRHLAAIDHGGARPVRTAVRGRTAIQAKRGSAASTAEGQAGH